MNEKTTLTLGSLFDGSGDFLSAVYWRESHRYGASEIEPFPIRVTTKRIPFMKHYGDISAMNGAEVEPVDIISFGSPCQDMSISGTHGVRRLPFQSFYEAVRIIKEMRCATMANIQDTSSGRMSQEHFHLIKDRTSKPYSMRSSASRTGCRGAYA